MSFKTALKHTLKVIHGYVANKIANDENIVQKLSSSWTVDKYDISFCKLRLRNTAAGNLYERFSMLASNVMTQ